MSLVMSPFAGVLNKDITVHHPSNSNSVSCVFLGFSLCITPAGLFVLLKESLPTSLGLSPLSKLET